MYDHILRQPKKTIFLPLAQRVSISPNALTGVGLLFGLISALLCSLGALQSALVFWIVNRIFDGLDGEVARAQQSQTDLGGYLDILADLLIYAFIPIGLAASSSQPHIWPVLSVMLASFYFNVGSWMYLSSILEKLDAGAAVSGESTSVTMPRGLIEGAETVLFFTLFLLLPQYLLVLFLLFTGLTFTGALLRVRWAQKRLPILSAQQR